MRLKRGSGILLHITSLPSCEGIGNLGPQAYAFADFLASAGQSYWQVLPLNPPSPGEGNSPYSSESAFAGNTLLISPELLARDGLIPSTLVSNRADFPSDRVDFGKAIDYKETLFAHAFENFQHSSSQAEFEAFQSDSAYWLSDYALFMALKKHFGGKSWSDWPQDIKERNQIAIKSYSDKLYPEIEKQKFLQFVFYKQWMAFKTYNNGLGIEIFGDIPIYMSYQSADVWAHPEIFKLDSEYRPLFSAGVPPDYFSRTGQLWGNPVYNWEKLNENNFDWWAKRINHNLISYDLLRIDHFRGLVAHWEVPAAEKTAINGRWVGVPAAELFRHICRDHLDPPIVAEDLGIITADVREVIEKLGIPGMKVLLFAFSENVAENPYAPHNHVKNSVIYTGTHDNNTVRGWFEEDASETEKASIKRYLGHQVSAETISEELVRLALMSVGDLAIIPMQDLLGLGADARMNTPSTGSGNWEWRLSPDMLTPALAARFREMTEIYGRLAKKDKQMK